MLISGKVVPFSRLPTPSLSKALEGPTPTPTRPCSPTVVNLNTTPPSLITMTDAPSPSTFKTADVPPQLTQRLDFEGKFFDEM